MDPSQPQAMQQPQGQQVYTQPMHANKIVSSRGFHIAKIVLGSIIMAVAIIVIGLAGGLWATYYDLNSYELLDYVVILMAINIPVACSSMCWQIAEFITLCVRKDRGIHPGAHVGIHLVLWLACSTAAGMTTTLVVVMASFDSYRSYSSYYSTRRVSSSRMESLLAHSEALMAFVYILLLLHFTLFVRACVECSRRNRRPAVFVVGGAPGASGVYYIPATQMAQPVQYMQPLQQPQPAYSPAQQHQQPGGHMSMYGGYYNAPQMPQPPFHEKTAELQTNSPTTVPASAVSTVSSDPVPANHHTSRSPEVP